MPGRFGDLEDMTPEELRNLLPFMNEEEFAQLASTAASRFFDGDVPEKELLPDILRGVALAAKYHENQCFEGGDQQEAAGWHAVACLLMVTAKLLDDTQPLREQPFDAMHMVAHVIEDASTRGDKKAVHTHTKHIKTALAITLAMYRHTQGDSSDAIPPQEMV